MSELYALCARISIRVSNVCVIDRAGSRLEEVRGYLNAVGVPNAVVGERVIAAPEDVSVLETLRRVGLEHRNAEPSSGQTKLDQFLEKDAGRLRSWSARDPLICAKLASSAVRLRIRGVLDVLAAGAKLYLREGIEVSPEIALRKHEAYTVAVHYFSKVGHVLVVDPGFKLETYRPLADLKPELRRSVTKVKLREPVFGFVLHEVIENAEDDLRDRAERTLEALRKLHPSTSPARSFTVVSGIARVTPLGRRLLEYLKELRLLNRESVRGNAGGAHFAYLPLSVLFPVATLEQLKGLGVNTGELKLWMSPQVRYEMAQELLSRIGQKLKIGGVEIEVKGGPVELPAEQLKAVSRAASTDSVVSPGDVARRGWWSSAKPLREGETPRVAVACTCERVERSLLEELRRGLRSWLETLTRLKVSVEMLDSKPLQSHIRELAARAKDSGFNAVVLVGCGSDDEYARFECELSKVRLVPQYIDGQRLASTGGGALRHYSFPIAKGIAWRLGWRHVMLEAPEPLRSAHVVGVDRTYVRVGRGVSLAVAAVMQSADGLQLMHLQPKYVEDEEGAVLEVAREVKASLRGDVPVVFCVNRSLLSDELLGGLRSLFGDRLVVVGASKTHSAPRLLSKVQTEKDAVFANPPVDTYVVLDEEKHYGKYLVTSSTALHGERTLKPVLASIYCALPGLAPQDVVQYIFSTRALCVEAPSHVASLPWPLYRADHLCKKISRIAEVVREVPQNLELL